VAKLPRKRSNWITTRCGTHLKKEAFHSSILDLEIAGQSQQVLLRDVQYHPFKQLVLHVDFQRVDAKKKLHEGAAALPERRSQPGVKLSSDRLARHDGNRSRVPPSALPEFLEVDLSKIEAGQSLHAKDIALPNGVALAHVDAENPVVASATVPAGAVSDAAEGETPAA
jgi:large subunit ribosomal protein L25